MYNVVSGLQDQGLASVVLEGEANPDAGVMFTYTSQKLDLPDGITLQVRRGEIVRASGLPGFRADVTVTAQSDGQSDPARLAAIDLGKTRAAANVADASGRSSVKPLSFIDDPHAQSNYPSEEHRLLGLFRFWNAIHYFFPYKELMDKPWDTALLDFIPRMQQARDATEYGLTVAELVTRLQDSHGAISSSALTTYFGTHRPPVRVDVVEGQLAVTDIDEAAKASVDLRLGDVVLAVDGEDSTARRERLSKFLPASTPGGLHYSQAREVLKGPRDREARLKVRTWDGQVKEVSIARSIAGATRPSVPRKLPAYTVLPDGYGYVDVDRLTYADAAPAYGAVRNAPGLIVDLRGYIGDGSRPFIGAMVKKAMQPTLMISRPQYDGMVGEFRMSTTLDPSYKQAGATPYQGKVAVLIGPGTVSAAESACMALATMGLDVTFIGASTMGANGNVTNTTLPGGIAVRFTGMEVKFADGRQLQRRGVQPDIEVFPTLEAVALGRDLVIERAIEFLKGTPK
jgi:C-terminal processing protease CtpA/Prc